MSDQNIHQSFKDCIKQLKSKALELCYDDYFDYSHIDYNILIIENLMCNGRCHLVAVFKNYLIEDDKSEYLRRFYRKKELGPRLKKLFAYHEETSVIFPNYVPLAESKYLYNNVIKKQRVIDEQQSLDKIRKENKSKKNYPVKKEDRMFNSTIVGEILTSNQSVLRIVFGIDYKKNENTIEKNNKNDESDCDDFDKLINEVEKAEENADNINNNSLEAFHLTNKASKYKLKLVNKLTNNIQMKNKNSDKLYNITNNNSTNMTSSSNPNNFNINNNTNLNRYKNNNLLLKENSLQYNINSKTGKKQKNYNLNKTSPNKKYSEDKYENQSRNNQQNINSINSKTLYGLNFHSSNKIISNLINKEKKINLKSKSNANHYQKQNSEKLKTNIFNNNYIYNNNFPQNFQNIDRNNLFTNRNNKLNLVVRSYNETSNNTHIPKIDMNKIKQMNKNNKVNILNTNTNRNLNRNNNYILNNPNLFFTETDVLKSERNFLRKKNLKKNNIKTKFGPIISFTPLKITSKILTNKNNNANLIVVNEKIFKSMNHRNAKINHYLSNNTSNNLNLNQNSLKNKKNLVINEYNYKASSKKSNGQNYFNRFLNK